MKTIKVWVSTNKVGSKVEGEVQIPFDTPEHEIEEIAKETMFEMIDWNWKAI